MSDDADLKALLTELAAEVEHKRKTLTPAAFARYHLGIVREARAFLARIAAERRSADLSPHPRVDAGIKSCDEVIGQHRKTLAAQSLAPEAADTPDVADDDRTWRVAAGLSSGPPPPLKRDRRPQLGAGAPVEAQLSKSYFRATSQKYSNLSSGASAASENEDFCASRVETVNPPLTGPRIPARGRERSS